MKLTQQSQSDTSAVVFKGLLMVATGAMAAGVLFEPSLAVAVKASICALLALLVAAALHITTDPKKLVGFVDRSSSPLDHLIQSLHGNRLSSAIVLSSALSLYFELLLVRWQASCFQLFAYYKNVTLIACFLGLGIGFAIGARGRIWLPLMIPAVATQIIIFRALRDSPLAGLLNNPVPENLGFGLDESRLVVAASNVVPGLLISYGFLTLVFIATALTMVPLGQFTSRLMKRLPELPSYGWNLVGSIGGVVSFTVLAHLWAPPSVWLVLGVCAALPFLVATRQMLVVSVVATAAALAVLHGARVWSGVQDTYSPYQILSTREAPGSPFVLMVNHTYYQRALDLSVDWVDDHPELESRARYYELAYIIKPDSEDVLVLGSGLGNDVAAALRRGIGRVEAVEIDPVIYSLGQEVHPEQPYSDPRVVTTITDARRFIRRHGGRFDAIVYGLLDSHTLLSANTSVRLDSFVYTVEAFREARALLSDDGLLLLSFSLLSQEQGEKLYQMLEIAFDGQAPHVLLSGYDRGFAFVIGPGLSGTDPALVSGFEDVTRLFDNPATTTDPATDDWPFFYMPRRAMPIGYGVLIVCLLAATWILAARLLGRPGKLLPSLPCFFLGAGFMLIETRAITELGLLYGSTWQVISVTIVAVLGMAFFANLVILKRGCPPPVITYGLLICSLILGWVVGAGALSFSDNAELLLRTLIITLPLFFSGFAFSSELRRGGDIAGALSSNLLGAVVGGFLEYSSMRFGFQAQYIIGGIIYLLAFASSVRPPSWSTRGVQADRASTAT
ncbi:MAG: hypothetical protein ACC742_05930 [Thermoanaerobaculales bacterium]